MKKSINKFILLSTLCLSFISCQTMTTLSAIGLGVASATGVIDENTADSLLQTTVSVSKAVESITPENEYYIGRATASVILEKYAIDSSPKLTKYLNNICGTITINSDKPYLYKGYYVAILDTTEINAMATPGGHIFVTRGLIDITNSEDELAAVLAHEIAHIQKQHSVKAIKTSRFTKAGLDLTSSALSIATEGEIKQITDTFGESVKDVVNSLVDSGYSQDQEFEADELALTLLSNAGYNPYALDAMISSIESNQKDNKLGFYKTHPSAKSRKQKLSKHLKNFKQTELAQERIARFNTMK